MSTLATPIGSSKLKNSWFPTLKVMKKLNKKYQRMFSLKGRKSQDIQQREDKTKRR